MAKDPDNFGTGSRVALEQCSSFAGDWETVQPASLGPQVREVAALIRQGKFPHDSDDWIVISHTEEWGYVIFNGQHRIAAIVLAGKAVTTWVWSDLPLSIEEQFRRWEIANGEREEIEEIDEPEWFRRANYEERDPKWSPLWGENGHGKQRRKSSRDRSSAVPTPPHGARKTEGVR